jgi:ABC-type hemin transport system substrate-binding protein
VDRDGEATLLVIEKGRAASRRVRIVESRGGSVVVNGPLTASDQVIVEAGGIREGEAVLAGEEMR